MNIIAARQESRKNKIAQMTASIKKAEEPDLKKLVLICMREWGMSERTVKEYLKVALLNIEYENAEESS